MSYDLDAAFSTRGQGALISAMPMAQSMVRSPGLAQVSQIPGYIPLMKTGNSVPMAMGGFMDEPLNLPVIGPVKKSTVMLIGAAAIVAFLVFRK